MNMTLSVDSPTCENGHVLSPDNIYRSNFGVTLCLACRRDAREKKRGLDDLLTPFVPRTEDWKMDGACVEIDLDFMFPEQGMPVRKQRAVCAECPVRAECFITGMFESHGIWGGYTAPERKKMKREWNLVPWELVEALPRHEEAQSA